MEKERGKLKEEMGLVLQTQMDRNSCSIVTGRKPDAVNVFLSPSVFLCCLEEREVRWQLRGSGSRKS